MPDDAPFSTTKKIIGFLAGTGLVLCLAAGGYAYWRLRDSLPVVEGQARLPGLAAEAKVERDALGVARISAASEADAYRALGYCHAQDRFFQMDGMRRRAAGELSELVGEKTLELDKAVRTHDFRRLATETYAGLPAGQRALAEAYAQGVNAGLASLSSPPWEYALLRSTPRSWEPVDSLLVGYSMLMELQDEAYYERCLTVLRDTLGEPALRFFAPAQGPDDSTVDGSVAELPPIPSPAVIDLRPRSKPIDPDLQLLEASPPAWAGTWLQGAGSNAFAVAGAHTRSGAALVANDMHLGLAVPNTWYRASLSWPSDKAGETVFFAGLTLPGTPMPITGSNGKVAWGFTASYADTADLVPIETDPLAPDYYRAPGRDEPFTQHTHRILVRGGEPVEHSQKWTRWGPVIIEAKGKGSRSYALEWIAHKPGAVNLDFTRIVNARNVAEAVDIGRSSGVPALNMLVADREGAIAWTLAGRLPQRRAYSGRLPVVHSLGDRGWDGFLPPGLTPSLVYPKDGYLSSANERLFGGDRLAALGDGGYAAPARARQLRAGVAAAAERGSLAPADMLALQLDDRSLELQHWRDLLVTALSKPGAPSTDERRALLRLAKSWDGRAGADSAGQLIARTFRRAVEKAVMEPLMEPCVEKFPGFRWTRFNSGPAIRKILEERPAHLLDPRFGSWEALLLQAADDTAAACAPLGEKTWADQNTAAIRHPLLRGLPRLLSSWADMPADPLSGDSDVPRVARPSFGASERFAVSPGRESEAYLHMPGGQSAHPLSPWFRAGHQAWVRGVAQPFLPGPARATLVLKP